MHLKGWFTEMNAKQKIQLPEQPEVLVQQLRGARSHAQLMTIWTQGQKEAYRFGVLALLLLTRILCALRRDQRAAVVFKIASLRWKQMLEKANAPKEHAKLNSAQASMVMKAVPDWMTGWNPLLDNTSAAETIVSQVRDPARPREVGGGATGFGIEVLAQLLPRPHKASLEWIRRQVSKEIGGDLPVERVHKALHKLQSQGKAVETAPGEWCRWEWATGEKGGPGGEPPAPASASRPAGSGRPRKSVSPFNHPKARAPASSSRPARAKSDNTPEDEEDFPGKSKGKRSSGSTPPAAGAEKQKSPRKTAKGGASSPAKAAGEKGKSPGKTAKKGASSPAPAGKAKPDQNGVIWQ